MDKQILKPETISVQQLISLRDQRVTPIDGLNIPNITVPPHLVGKRRPTEVRDSLVINIRQLFNSLTTDNITKVKQQLRDTIVQNAKTEQDIDEIAEEILSNFIISEVNIKNYMHLLNAISPCCILITSKGEKGAEPNETGEVLRTPTIGNLFLRKCKDMMSGYVDEEKDIRKIGCLSEINIRSLAILDLEDTDQLDAYNREREKIINLIITVCHLYDQRHTTNIRLSSVQIYSLMYTILEYYQRAHAKMKELGDPNEVDCTDEDEYEVLRKMCTLYAEQLYTFIQRERAEFIKDNHNPIKGQTLKDLVDRFHTEIVATLTEAYLVSKCNELLS